MQQLDCAVIGAGVVGLAIARKLAMAGRHVVVLEAERAMGMHTSSRNSEVIHAGIYYEAGTAKARLCAEGRRLLYAYCARRDIPHRRIGKIIVAVRDEEVGVLERYARQAAGNGVDDLVWLDRKQIGELEPHVVCKGGFLSPSTGIVDSHALMASLKAEAVESGADVVFSSPVVGGRVVQGGIELEVGGAEPSTMVFASVVNAAGLYAQTVARSISGLDAASIPPEFYARGHYFLLARKAPFRRLVYPIPVAGGLGVHVTLDLGGAARFGPDVSWCSGVDYQFDETRATSFYSAIRAYYPALAQGDLIPGFVGIRPKLVGPGQAGGDFVIQGPSDHGVFGLVNLYGIESPGLTSCLAIAEEVARILAG